MRIDPNQGTTPGQSTESVRTAHQRTASQIVADTQQAADPQDRANFSSDAQQLSNLNGAIANVPTVRQSRVDALRQAVQSGSYNPSNQDIANSLMSDFAVSR